MTGATAMAKLTAYTATNTAWVTAASSAIYNSTYWPTGAGTCTITYDGGDWDRLDDALRITDGRVKLPAGRALAVQLADGSVLHVDEKGNFRLDDAAATVIYKANRLREFNRYVNASDLLAEFIQYLGTLRIRRHEVQALPLGLFVNWLVIRAAETDDDPVPADIVPVPRHRLLTSRVRPRCLACQRFIPRALSAAGFSYCNPDHATTHYRRLAAA